MFILGLTGSIGMGKTATAAMFADEGVPVHDADAVVHRLYEGEATPLIEAAFPGTTSGGKVDRAKLGERVLGDKDAIARLEQIVHPLVTKARERFVAEAERSGPWVPLVFCGTNIMDMDCLPLDYSPPGNDLSCNGSSLRRWA